MPTPVVLSRVGMLSLARNLLAVTLLVILSVSALSQFGYFFKNLISDLHYLNLHLCLKTKASRPRYS